MTGKTATSILLIIKISECKKISLTSRRMPRRSRKSRKRILMSNRKGKKIVRGKIRGLELHRLSPLNPKRTKTGRLRKELPTF